MKQLLNAIEKSYGISSILYDQDGKMMDKSSKIREYRLFHWLKEYSIDLTKITLVIHKTKIGAVVIPVKEQYLVLGNMFVGKRNEQRLWMIMQHMSKDEETYFDHLQEISLSELKKLCTLISIWCNDEERDFVLIENEREENKRLHFSDQEKYGLLENYRILEKMMECIQYGKPDALKKLMKYEKFEANEQNFNQQKMNFIQLCALVSISLFKGGLGIYETHTFSEYYQQKVSQSMGEKEIHELQKEMLMSAAHTIQQHQSQKMGHPMTKKIQQYLQIHLHESIDFKQMADELGISKNYMLSTFKKETGKSLVDYMYTQKVNEAVFLLHQQKLTVAQIASYLGFSSSSYFITWFKKIKGTTPKEFLNK